MPSLSDNPSNNLELTDLEKGSSTGSSIGEASVLNDLPTIPIIGHGFLKPVQDITTSERIAAAAGSVAVLTSLAAMLFGQSFPVVLAGLLSSATGIYLYYQQTRLTDIQTLTETKTALMSQVNIFVQLNEKLGVDIDHLRDSVGRLRELEQATALLNSTESFSVDIFAAQIQENKGILKSLKSNVQAVVLQNLLSVILRSDVDQDMVISENELDDMLLRMSNIAGLSINEERLRDVCCGQSIETIMDLVRDSLLGHGEQKNAVFRIRQS